MTVGNMVTDALVTESGTVAAPENLGYVKIVLSA